MRLRLRTLLILFAAVPALLAGAWSFWSGEFDFGVFGIIAIMVLMSLPLIIGLSEER